MTPAQRTTLSFLDLAMIMTGVMAMIASVGDRHPAVADALAESFGPKTSGSSRAIVLPLTELFEPQEARLTAGAGARIAKLAAAGPTAQISIAVPVMADDRGSRLDRWELAAARTAAIMRVLADQGIADDAMIPDLARPGAGAARAMVTLTVRDSVAER